VAPLLYPKPFEITIDTRNSYLETQSMQVKGFIWYNTSNSNGREFSGTLVDTDILTFFV
jgi:hypothetical protein